MTAARSVDAARELVAKAAQLPYRLVDHLQGVLTGRQGFRRKARGSPGSRSVQTVRSAAS